MPKDNADWKRAGIWRLNEKLIRIWAILSHNQGHPVSREAIVDFCLRREGKDHHYDYIVALLVRLKRIIGKDRIITVRGYGYMLK